MTQTNSTEIDQALTRVFAEALGGYTALATYLRENLERHGFTIVKTGETREAQPELERLKELAENATPGPWCVDDPNTSLFAQKDADGIYNYLGTSDPSSFARSELSRKQIEANCAFIAAANPQRVLALIAEIEKKS
jgi:hypothetical protein